MIVTTPPILRPMFKLQGHIKESQFLANGFPRLAWEENQILYGAISTGSRSWQSSTPVDEQPLSQGRFIHLNSDGVVANYERRNEELAASAAAAEVARLAREHRARKANEAQRKAKPKKLTAATKCWMSLVGPCTASVPPLALRARAPLHAAPCTAVRTSACRISGVRFTMLACRC